MMPEAADPQVHLAKPVEEQQSRLNYRALEFLMNEFEWRQFADLEQPPPRRALLKQRASRVGRQRRRTSLPCQDILHDGNELLLPAQQRLGVTSAELSE